MITACTYSKKIGEKVNIGWYSDEKGIIHKIEHDQPAIIMKEVTKEDYLNDPGVLPWVNRMGKEYAEMHLDVHDRKYFYEYSTD